MKFMRAVQRQRVAAPTSKAFTPDEWRAALSALADDEHDQALGKAGIWIYQLLEATRSKHRFVTSPGLDAKAKLKSIVAFVNYAAIDAWRDVAAFVESKRHENLYADELLSAKVTLPNGDQFQADETLESIGDGAQVMLRFVLHGENAALGKTTLGGVSFDDVQFDLNMAIQYAFLERVWNKLLWEDYRISDESLPHIEPTNRENLDWFVVTRYRNDRLAQGVRAITLNHMKNGVRVSQWRDVAAIERVGKSQRIVLCNEQRITWASSTLVEMFAVVRSRYYGELWRQPSEVMPGLTLDLLLQAWCLVASAVEVLMKRIPAPESFTDKEAFTPQLHHRALCSALCSSLNISNDLACQLIDALVYKGLPGNDLWAQPLVRLSSDRLMPLIPCAYWAKPTRLVDVWLKILDINVESKGDVFEASVRSAMVDTLAESPYWLNATVLPYPLKLHWSSYPEVELDLVIVLGTLVVIGESKCHVQPDEPEQWGRHRKRVLDAAQQISKAARTLNSNKVRFASELRRRGAELADSFEILPIVVLNSALHVGRPCEGIPVVDIAALESYFIGRLNNATVEDADGRVSLVKEVVLYKDAEEGVAKLRDYLCDLPQLRNLWRSLKDCAFPIFADDPRVTSPVAVLRSREVQVDVTQFDGANDP